MTARQLLTKCYNFRELPAGWGWKDIGEASAEHPPIIWRISSGFHRNVLLIGGNKSGLCSADAYRCSTDTRPHVASASAGAGPLLDRHLKTRVSLDRVAKTASDQSQRLATLGRYKGERYHTEIGHTAVSFLWRRLDPDISLMSS